MSARAFAPVLRSGRVILGRASVAAGVGAAAFAVAATPAVAAPATAAAPQATSVAAASSSRAGLAKAVLANRRITLLHFCGPAYASPGANIRDAAAGRASYTGGGDVGKRAVYLSTSMLAGLQKLGTNHSIRVTAILGCDHSSTSRHYRGTAVDIDYADGVKINTTAAGRTKSNQLKAACRALGATEVLGVGDPGHSTHVHCAW